MTATDYESAVLDALDFEPDLDDVPSAALEALERVQKMGAGDGLTVHDLRAERMAMLSASAATVTDGQFRVFVQMLFGARIDHGSEQFVFDRGNEWLADECGASIRTVRRHLRDLREQRLLDPVRYGGWRGDAAEVGVWAFTTPEERDGGDLYTLAERWVESRGSTATAHRRRDFVAAMMSVYGSDVIVPEHLPAEVRTAGDAARFVDHLRVVHRR
ncbi:helix-turn-helix domain-containing protein [Brevibacterium sp. R8603A2]|uniref:helix-turn-helix domain-containing protein n=1 Tax=Brevibacterium sp. R8603A2 TaxID=2929779 RepID=UPI001FFB0360|nr:helix-turn-helix domain-containing protein [Brevibacterium sp. R8603A2]MCK1802962.1 helix-turn-helix domain-containing protein [Brevibacterium sp. R8603A2]